MRRNLSIQQKDDRAQIAAHIVESARTNDKIEESYSLVENRDTPGKADAAVSRAFRTPGSSIRLAPLFRAEVRNCFAARRYADKGA